MVQHDFTYDHHDRNDLFDMQLVLYVLLPWVVAYFWLMSETSQITWWCLKSVCAMLFWNILCHRDQLCYLKIFQHFFLMSNKKGFIMYCWIFWENKSCMSYPQNHFETIFNRPYVTHAISIWPVFSTEYLEYQSSFFPVSYMRWRLVIMWLLHVLQLWWWLIVLSECQGTHSTFFLLCVPFS